MGCGKMTWPTRTSDGVLSYRSVTVYNALVKVACILLDYTFILLKHCAVTRLWAFTLYKCTFILWSHCVLTRFDYVKTSEHFDNVTPLTHFDSIATLCLHSFLHYATTPQLAQHTYNTNALRLH